MLSKFVIFIFVLISLQYELNAQIIPLKLALDSEDNVVLKKGINGDLLIKDNLIADTLFRFEYNSCGKLLLKCSISRESKIDSIFSLDKNTYEEYLQIHGHLVDTPNGMCIFYHENGFVESKGNLKGINKIGNWKEYFDNGKLKRVVNYNEQGLKEGEYIEYGKDGNLQLKGEYSVKVFKQKIKLTDLETYEFINKIRTVETAIELKSGLWESYNYNGEVVFTIVYE